MHVEEQVFDVKMGKADEQGVSSQRIIHTGSRKCGWEPRNEVRAGDTDSEASGGRCPGRVWNRQRRRLRKRPGGTTCERVGERWSGRREEDWGEEQKSLGGRERPAGWPGAVRSV